MTVESTASHEPTEGEQVIAVLHSFQKIQESMQEQLKVMQSQIGLLDSKVNKETPAILDQAFKDLKENDAALATAINQMRTGSQQTPLAAAATQGQGSNTLQNIFSTVMKAIEGGGGSSGAGGLSDFDKEILKMSKQIQLVTLKDAYKRVSQAAGIVVSDHIVVNP